MAKKKLTKRQIAARRAARKARLEAELADLEAEGGPVDDEDEDEDEDDYEDEGDEWDEDDDYLPAPRRGSALSTGKLDVGGVIGMLGEAAASMSNMGVEDTTPPDAEGNPGLKFQRHAGRIRNVKMGRDGQPLEVDFEPEEWPPRGESF